MTKIEYTISTRTPTNHLRRKQHGAGPEADDRGDAIVNARRDEAARAEATLARVLGDVAALDVELVLRGELVKRRFHALRASGLCMSTNARPRLRRAQRLRPRVELRLADGQTAGDGKSIGVAPAVLPGECVRLLPRGLGRGEEFAGAAARIALYVTPGSSARPLQRTDDGPHAVSFPRRWRIARSGPRRARWRGAFHGVLNGGCSGLWQIVRKPDAELSRLSRIEMPRMYRIRQSRIASKVISGSPSDSSSS